MYNCFGRFTNSLISRSMVMIALHRRFVCGYNFLGVTLTWRKRQYLLSIQAMSSHRYRPRPWRLWWPCNISHIAIKTRKDNSEQTCRTKDTEHQYFASYYIYEIKTTLLKWAISSFIPRSEKSVGSIWWLDRPSVCLSACPYFRSAYI